MPLNLTNRDVMVQLQRKEKCDERLLCAVDELKDCSECVVGCRDITEVDLSGEDTSVWA